MAIGKTLLLTQLDYTVWANQVLLEAFSGLTEEESLRELGASHGSLLRTLRHVYDAERAWVDNLISHSIPSVAEIEAAGAADQSRSLPTYAFLKDSFPKVWSDARRWLEPLREDELATELTCVKEDGVTMCLPRWKVLLHMVNHSTLHRGQMITMLRALGKRPPNTDLFTYYRFVPVIEG